MKRRLAILISALVFVCAPIGVPAQTLPTKITPEEPFPRIDSEAPFSESIAPGIEYARYNLLTASGPIEICVVAIAPQNENVRVDTVLASDAITSRGETVSSMARRTGAVAGINADYFDIGSTNRPTNIVVAGGRLLRTPRQRYQLLITHDGLPHIIESAFSGEVDTPGGGSVPLDAVNEMAPPNGGVSLLTPQFGPVAPEENLTLIPLTPVGGTPPFASYRVSDPVDNLQRQNGGYYLAVGPNAYGKITIPNAGETIAVLGDLSPLPLSSVVSAVGGGPLILHEGRWFDDADGPSGGEYSARIPSSGAAIAPDGTLFLIEIDGRQPQHSIGVTRREFSAVMRALGAIEGMAFDGGGSSELVVRRLGEPDANVTSSPSDGRERDVADGFFVYSTAPVGEAVRLVSRPLTIRTLRDAPVEVRVAALDASGHVVPAGAAIGATVEPASAGSYHDGVFTAQAPGVATIHFHAGMLHGETHVAVVDAPARMAIIPATINLDAHGRASFSIRAYDAAGYPLELPASARWQASGGVIDVHGNYVAGSSNASVSVSVDGTSAMAHVTVGSHSEPLAFAPHAHFATLAPGGDGGLTRDPQCDRCVILSYVLNAQIRAAYAMAPLELPKDSVGIAFDLHDDGDGAAIKVALRNAINEQILVPGTTLAHAGWRHVVVRFPPGLAQPLRLESIYALHDPHAGTQQGTIVIKDVRALVAGS